MWGEVRGRVWAEYHSLLLGASCLWTLSLGSNSGESGRGTTRGHFPYTAYSKDYLMHSLASRQTDPTPPPLPWDFSILYKAHRE